MIGGMLLGSVLLSHAVFVKLTVLDVELEIAFAAEEASATVVKLADVFAVELAAASVAYA